ncbi:MAG: DUF7594 domain-containing protein [Bacillota bacterium]
MKKSIIFMLTCLVILVMTFYGGAEELETLDQVEVTAEFQTTPELVELDVTEWIREKNEQNQIASFWLTSDQRILVQTRDTKDEEMVPVLEIEVDEKKEVLEPVDDVSIQKDNKYHTDDQYLFAYYDGEGIEGYMKFDLGNLEGEIESAKLKVYAYLRDDVASADLIVKSLYDDDWSQEEEMTWDERPTLKLPEEEAENEQIRIGDIKVDAGPAGIPRLKEIIESELIFEAYRLDRLKAVNTLEEINDPEVIPALKSALIQEEIVKTAAIDALLEVDERPVSEIVIDLLRDKRDYRTVSLNILEKSIDDGEDIVDTLEAMFNLLEKQETETDTVLKNKMINLVSSLYEKIDVEMRAEVISLLEEKTEKETDFISIVASRSLGEIGSDAGEAVPVLIDIVEDRDISRDKRIAAALALELIAPTDNEVNSAFVDIIIDLDNASQLRWPAVRAVEKAGFQNVDDLISLIDVLEDLEASMRWRLAHAFVEMGRDESKVVTELNTLLTQDVKKDLRLWAIRVLGTIGDENEETIEKLVSLVDRENDDQHLRAIADTLDLVAASDERIREVQKQVPETNEESSEDPLPAFPGAEGKGAYATGGRNGEVYIVTNLKDAGPGSLRDAVSESDRIVVFQVSGNIELNSELRIQDNITIAGQTAPGDGITVRDYPTTVFGSDVIIRNMRFRLGDKHNLINSDAFTIMAEEDISDVIIDHSSFSWGNDETLSTYGNENITIQKSLIGEGLNLVNHSCGGLWGPRASYHNNLIYSNKTRNPKFAYMDGDIADFRNNVVYNWWETSTYIDSGKVNLIGNYFKPGPSTNESVKDKIIDPTATIASIYLEDNFMENSPEVTDDNHLGVMDDYTKSDEPFSTSPVSTVSPEEAYDNVLEDSGATVPARDEVDKRVIKEVKEEKGQILHRQGEIGGWPELFTILPPVDSDEDGMPDMWEIYHGLDPYDAEDANQDRTGDGYTNLEEYINTLTEEHVLWDRK